MHRHLQVRWLFLVVFLSGFAGLGYEMVWTRMFTVGLGHEILAVLAVVAAFFGGLALGAYSLDGPIRRSRVPGHWYALLEFVIGLWSLALIGLIPAANRLAATLIGADASAAQHWLVAFLLPFLALLPATFAMGGTLPAMERLVARLRRDGWSVAGVYATNTLGAVAGTLLATFLLVPALGFTATLVALAAVNLLCAAAVLVGAARGEAARPPVTAPVADVPPGPWLLGTVFVTGLLGIGYEVVVVRVVSQVLENTVYTFAAVLSVYLFGTAVGAALYQRSALRNDFARTAARLMQTTAVACLLGTVLLWTTDALYELVRTGLGAGLGGSVAAELAVAAAVFLLPTLSMGALFSHLAQACRDRHGFGVALGVNTAGAALAPLLFGVLLLPALGAKATLIGLSLAYLVLTPPGARRAHAFASAAAAAAGVALLLAQIPLRFVTIPPDGALVEHREGVMAAVSVVRDGRGDLHLKVNDRFRMGGTASAYSDQRQAHISLLLHPRPRHALFLGLGTGVTFFAALDHPGLEADGVELVPEVVELLPYFLAPDRGDPADGRARIVTADARRFVRATGRSYDVVIADLFHPARDGAGSLYTVEHFEAVRGLLRDGGIFCQWLPLYQLDLATLRTIVRTYLEVFPQGAAFLAHFSLQTPILGLISATPPGGYPADWLEQRARYPALRDRLEALRLDGPYALFGNYLGGSAELRQFAGDAPLNTDDRPRVLFEAPRFAYAGQQPPYERLLALIDALRPAPDDLLAAPTTDPERQSHERLRRYWQARDRFLHLGVGVAGAGDVQQMLGRLREPLLELVRLSPDFAPAYDPLLAMARSLRPVDPDATRELLLALADANRTRPEAGLLLDRLFPAERRLH
jgi:spermidine synthase